MIDYGKFNEMFGALQGIKMPEPLPPTMLEVAGIANKETAISRILGFFLSSDEVHGMGNLWMRSLLECAGSSKADQCSDVSVNLEVGTDEQKRIDILASCDDFNVAIENKIDAGLNNPLGSYKKEATVGDREAVLIVLSKWQIDACPDKESDSGDDVLWSAIPRDWIHVTYDQLFEAVWRNGGQVFCKCDVVWFEFAKDFMESIGTSSDTDVEKKKGEEIAEIEAFLQLNTENILQLFELISKQKTEMSRLMNDFQGKIDNEISESSRLKATSSLIAISSYTWKSGVIPSDRVDLFHNCVGVVCERKNPSNNPGSINNLKLEAWRDNDGWHIAAFTGSLKGNNSLSKIESLLQKREEDTQFGMPCGKTKLAKCDYSATCDDVIKVFVEKLEMICSKIN